MAFGRTASLLFFFLLLYQSPAWATCPASDECRPGDRTCEARREEACREEEDMMEPHSGAEPSNNSVESYSRPGRQRYHSQRRDGGPRPTVAPETSGGGRIGGGNSPDTSTILASRLFVGPHNFPPEQYGAYGIVAFPTLSTPDTKDRFRLVCQAYWATLPPSSDLDVPISEQMVTVWPVDDPKPLASVTDEAEACEYAVQHYHLKTSLLALKQ